MITRYYTTASDSETFTGPDGPFVLYADYAKLEASLASYQAARVHDIDEKAWLSKRVSKLEAAINERNEGVRQSCGRTNAHNASLKGCASYLPRGRNCPDCPEDWLIEMPSTQPPLSTLCAVCDQIKELHPSTHPWTEKPPHLRGPVIQAYADNNGLPPGEAPK